MKLTFTRREAVADHIFSFWFEPAEKVTRKAGQYTRLSLPHQRADDRGTSRFFTISAAPTEDMWAITTKFSEPASSFKKTLFNLKPGAELEAALPSGEFTLPQDESHPFVLVAGGIGVTPYRSMLKYLADSNQSRQVHLIYTASTPAELAFRPLFDALKWLKVTYVVTNPSPDWKEESGKLDGKRILDLASGPAHKYIYLSGPEPMVEAFYDQLKELGVGVAQLRTDYFPGYPAF